MCRGPKKPSPPSTSPENSSFLLFFSANNDLSSFKKAVDDTSAASLDISSPWFTRSTSGRMVYANRTPTMIAALYGSIDILSYILSSHSVDVNRRCDPDGVTALHCAVAGASPSSLLAVKLLLNSSADVDAVDANGNRPSDVIPNQSPLCRRLEILLKKKYPFDSSLPDIKNGIFGTDEFRMYVFKVRPCSRAYSHDWTECPFVHPGENARRRDPRKYGYGCAPCPDFRRGCCLKADRCEYAHGVFECWLHPANYRTRLCKDEGGCDRRVCFFAHKVEELRTAVNLRRIAFGERSRSFVDRGVDRHISAMGSPIDMSDWGSADGKLDWGIQGDELNKLRKFATFNFRGEKSSNFGGVDDLEAKLVLGDELDLSWVHLGMTFA